MPFCQLPSEGDADTIFDKEIKTINQIYNDYPALRHVPIINDEADLEVGWWKRREWRADARYAALAARSVIIHQQAKSTIPHFNYKLMSFDNAFLNYRPSFFDQRTLLARFQINSTKPHQVQFVKKPAYTIMAMLSLLGDTTLDYTTSVIDDRLSVLSTCRNCVTGRPTDLASEMRKSTSPDLASDMRKSASQDLASEMRKSSRINESPTGESIGREDKISNYLAGLRNSEDENKTEITEPASVVDGGTRGTATESDGSEVPVSWEGTLFLSFSNGTQRTDGDVMKVRVSFALPKSIVGKYLSVVTYRLRGDRKGPYEAWLELGCPIEPNRTELAYIRSFEGPMREGPKLLEDVPPVLSFKVNLNLPEVYVIHICLPNKSDPGQVTNVNTLKVTASDVLITWSDVLINTRCVLHYEVQRSEVGRYGPFATISNQYVADNNYLFSLPEISESATVTGWYRVRVVTYWGTTGPFSEPVHHVS